MTSLFTVDIESLILGLVWFYLLVCVYSLFVYNVIAALA